MSKRSSAGLLKTGIVETLDEISVAHVKYVRAATEVNAVREVLETAVRAYAKQMLPKEVFEGERYVSWYRNTKGSEDRVTLYIRSVRCNGIFVDLFFGSTKIAEHVEVPTKA